MRALLRLIGIVGIADGVFLALAPRAWGRWWTGVFRKIERGTILARLVAIAEIAVSLYLIARRDDSAKHHRDANAPGDSESAPAGPVMMQWKQSRLLKILFRLPLLVYRLGLGRLFRHRLLLLTHRGRRSGRLRQTVLEVVRYDPRTHESTVVSGWGERADWYRNIQASPPISIETGEERYVPTFRVASRDEAYATIEGYLQGLPPWLRPIARPLVRRIGFDVAGSDEARRAHAAKLLFVIFRPREGVAREALDEGR